jgi:hypothetical protein
MIMRGLAASLLALTLTAPPEVAADVEAGGEAGSEAEPEAEPARVEPPAPVLTPPQPAAPVELEVDPRNYRMVLAGDIVIGLAGAGLIAMVAGLGIRADARSQRAALTVATSPDVDAIAHQDQRIELGTILAISGGVTAGAMFTTGITLVALGYARERKRRESERVGALTLVPSPSFDRTGFGLRWSLRF